MAPAPTEGEANNVLLQYFKAPTRKQLLEDIKSKEFLENPSKLNTKFEDVLGDYYRIGYPTLGIDPAVEGLAAILEYRDDEIQVPQSIFGKLLNAIIADSAASAAKGATAIKVPALIIVKAVCKINPLFAFEEIDDDDDRRDGSNFLTPFERAAKAGVTEIVVAMSEALRNRKSATKNGPKAQETMRKDRSQLKDNKDLPLKAKDILSKRQEIRTDPKKAFLLAAENLRLGVLRHFLQHEQYKDKELADVKSLRATLSKAAVQGSMAPNGNMSEGQDPGLQAFKLIWDKVQPTEDDYTEIWTEAVTKSSEEVIRHLLATMPAKFATDERAKIIVEKGTANMWNLYRESVGGPLKDMVARGHLLHTAVQFRKADIVEAILDKFPKLIEVPRRTPGDDGTEKGEWAIEMLRTFKQDEKAISQRTSPYMRIRNSLLHAMIRSSSKDLGIKEIRSILRRAGVDANAMCLLLSNIDTEEQSFTEYVEWLKAHSDDDRGQIFKFESILKYAKFPDLNTQTPKLVQEVTGSMQADHTEIWTVFEWLMKRGVKEVLELSVPDRLFCPHSDDHVASCVNGFAVRVLRWRKLDLYLGNITDKDHLRELHLYSSGNRSVHDQWCRELPMFRRLKKLRVYVVTNVLSKDRVQQAIKELQTRLNELGAEHNLPWVKQKVGSDSSSSLPNVSVTEYDWAVDIRGKVYRNLDEITNNVVGPNLSAFIAKYHAAMTNRRAAGGKIPRTRVALIDSGVVVVSGKRNKTGSSATRAREVNGGGTKSPTTDTHGPLRSSAPLSTTLADQEQEERAGNGWWTDDLAMHIEDGKSFVTTGDNEEQVWWHASEPHGTQMARLICSIDPSCRLLVAKVAETRSHGISANVVAEAITWAIEQKVDIISLSLVTYAATDKMSDAIRLAHGRDIVVLSSSADEGLREINDAIRKDNAGECVFSIAACDRWGNLLERSPKSGYDYSFVGNNVQVGQVPFLKSPDSIGGSSVATAIAAGVISLIFAFCRLAKDSNTEHGPNNDNRWRTQMARARLNAMCEGTGAEKYVMLDNICGKGKRLKDADFIAEINTNFRRKWVSPAALHY